MNPVIKYGEYNEGGNETTQMRHVDLLYGCNVSSKSAMSEYYAGRGDALRDARDCR